MMRASDVDLDELAKRPERLAKFVAAQPDVAWLDTSLCADVAAPALSLLAARPVAILEQFAGQPAEFRAGERTLDSDPDFLTLLRRQHARLRPIDAAGGLGPGWVGHIGFEVAAQLERLTPRAPTESALPLARLALFDTVIVIDHHTGRADVRSDPRICALLGVPPAALEQRVGDLEAPAGDGAVPRVSHETSRAEFTTWVRRALDYIAAGDIYQVNLAHRIRVDGLRDPLATYLRLRRANSAPYGALLRWAGGAIASVSPELFLRVRGREVLTSPIKGTRPRAGETALDAAARADLLASAKDAAELAMIVDLHRNDISRTCVAGSVRVGNPRRLETHPRVFHTVADITGQLAPHSDALDLLATCFPAGSISGVPKIRALEIIGELEPVARGAYAGAIGHIGLSGDMTLNVAIRTLQCRGGVGWLHVGSGIVADSDPQAEYEETMAKARGILEAFGPVPDSTPVRADRSAAKCGEGGIRTPGTQ